MPTIPIRSFPLAAGVINALIASTVLLACGGAAIDNSEVQQASEESDTVMSGSALDSENPDAVVTDPPMGSPSVECASRIEANCSEDCSPLTSVDGVYRGCANADRVCTQAFTCGQSPSGEQATFRNGCLPSDWTGCDRIPATPVTPVPAPGPQVCTQAFTCGENAEGEQRIFNTGCLPPGWKRCS